MNDRDKDRALKFLAEMLDHGWVVGLQQTSRGDPIWTNSGEFVSDRTAYGYWRYYGEVVKPFFDDDMGDKGNE